MAGHVDDPKKKKPNSLAKRLDHQAQCRIRPCNNFDTGKGCIVCVHEGAIRRKLSGGKKMRVTIKCPSCGKAYEPAGCKECPFCMHEWEERNNGRTG